MSSLLANTAFLSIINLVRMISPFLALPYVIRTVGSDHFGEIAFAQSVAAFAVILVNFGLDVSAVKDISVNRNDSTTLSRIVSSVLGVKALLFVSVGVVYLLMITLIPMFRENALLFIVCYMIGFPDVIFPQWYFQGVERMKLLTVTSFISILFYLSSLFLLVKHEEHYILVPALQIGGLVISSFVGLYILLFVEKIKIVLPSRRELLSTFRSSIPFFGSRVSIVINQNLANLALGIFLGMSEVASFALAQKVITAGFIPFKMFNQAVYPHNARRRDSRFAHQLFLLTIVAAALASLVLYVLSPWLITMFAGTDSIIEQSISTMRYLLGYYFFGCVGMYLGLPTLMAWGRSKPFNASVYLSTLVLLLIYALLYATNTYSLASFALALMVVEIIIATYRYAYYRGIIYK